ncbi:MAG: FAD-binding oxidoreductase [Rhizobiales bacterium]|nr:FAD-binding oxidoreductase [Hyphomicrobiales bacterium]
MADSLLRAGFQVIAVDRREPMTGSTPASTSLLQFELDTPLTVLNRKVGRERAARAWIRSASAVGALGDRISDLQIDCDFRERSTVYLPGDVLDVKGLKREAEERQRLGLRSAFVDAKELRQLIGIAKSGAILSRGNGEADPAKMVAGLWRQFRADGGKVVSPFDAVEIDEIKSRVRVRAADGRRIIAKHVVMCTGYELPKFVQPKGLKVISTWAIATRPQRRNLWPGRELVWQAADPYLYMRTTLDGRVIAGGVDETFSDEEKRDRLIGKKSASLMKKAKRIFPRIDFEPHYAWTGNFGESETGMPAIGLVRGYKRTYAALGFGGNGITFSMLAAQIISRTIDGITDPDADVFRP